MSANGTNTSAYGLFPLGTFITRSSARDNTTTSIPVSKRCWDMLQLDDLSCNTRHASSSRSKLNFLFVFSLRLGGRKIFLNFLSSFIVVAQN
jgi:hypothetical protein